MDKIIILSGLVIIFLSDLNDKFSSVLFSKYLYEYIMVDFIPYILLFIIYLLVCKKTKYKFNVRYIPTPYYAGVMVFLAVESLFYLKIKEYAVAVNSVLMYKHYGIVVVTGVIAIIFLMLNRNYYHYNENESEEEKKYKMIKVVAVVGGSKLRFGVEFDKTFIVGFISGLIVVACKIIYYMIMK